MKDTIPRLDKTRILSEDEVRQTSKALRKLLCAEFPNMSPEFLSSAEDAVRMQSLRASFRQARELMNLTIKEIATLLKVPQYRLRAVEEGHRSEIDPRIFAKYADFLGLNQWAGDWIARNQKLAKKLRIG